MAGSINNHRVGIDVLRKIAATVRFPMYGDDEKPVLQLNAVQKAAIKAFREKIDNGDYRLVRNDCLCGNRDDSLDIVVSEKDRYGTSLKTILCTRCGLLRCKRRLDDKSLKRFYEYDYSTMYRGKEQDLEGFFKKRTDSRGMRFLSLVQRLGIMEDIDNVFESGCSFGANLYPFLATGKHVQGCDFDESYLIFGRKKGMDLYKGDIDDGITPDNSQDLIISSHVIEHLADPIQYMNGIIKKIKRNKFALIEVPGVFSFRKKPIFYFQNAHLYYYYHYYLKVLFECMGLIILYGDQRCSFVLHKPADWKPRIVESVYDRRMSHWASEIENHLKICYLKNNLIFTGTRAFLREVLVSLGIKDLVKSLCNKKQ